MRSILLRFRGRPCNEILTPTPKTLSFCVPTPATSVNSLHGVCVAASRATNSDESLWIKDLEPEDSLHSEKAQWYCIHCFLPG
jgi:hypothetical protein